MKLSGLYSHTLMLALCVAAASSCHTSKKTAGDTASQTTETKSTNNTPTSNEPKITYDVVEGLNLGNTAPEISLPDPNGNIIKLTSLRGKVVLIDFWASWCGPCRRENPTVVAAAKKYKDTAFKNGTGFTVYSVSLDKGKDSWTRAIQDDGLFWPNHVSDLALWNNAAAIKYNVSAIPTNVLINGDGVIIAKGLRGEALTDALEKYLK